MDDGDDDEGHMRPCNVYFYVAAAYDSASASPMCSITLFISSSFFFILFFIFLFLIKLQFFSQIFLDFVFKYPK